MSKFQITVLGLLAAIACAVFALIGVTGLIIINQSGGTQDVALVETVALPVQEALPALPTPTGTQVVAPTGTSTATPESTPTPANTQVVPPTGTSVPIPPTSTPVPASTPTPVSSLQKAYVTNVVDGDTIDVLIGDNEYRVRYILIDTPENNSGPYGEEATKVNRRLVLGKVVTLEKDVSETDRYDRLLRYVYIDGKMINEELVKLGLAQVTAYPPDLKHFFRLREAQEVAQVAGVGFWGAQTTATVAPGLGIIVDENSPNRPIRTVATPTPRNTQGTTGSVCDCSYNKYNCANFSSQSAAQECYEYCWDRTGRDVHDLDRDNGIACEHLR